MRNRRWPATIAIIWVACLLPAHAQRRSMADMAASDPGLATLRARILDAADHRDFAMLMPLFDETFDIDQHESQSADEFRTLIQNWPEDFGPPFWRALRDIMQSGVRDMTVDGDDYVWQRPGVMLAVSSARNGWKITHFIRDAKPRTKIMPVDAAMADPGLASVRAQFVRAIDRRDADLLLPIVAPQVHRDDGESIAGTTFVAELKNCRDDCNERWQELHDAISLGMAMSNWEGSVVAPYTFVKCDDEPGRLIITGRRVALRAAPAPRAAVVEWLSYDVVKIMDDWDGGAAPAPLRVGHYSYDWQQLQTLSGTRGWVSAQYVRFGSEPRVFFKKIDGAWKLMALTRGD